MPARPGRRAPNASKKANHSCCDYPENRASFRGGREFSPSRTWLGFPERARTRRGISSFWPGLSKRENTAMPRFIAMKRKTANIDMPGRARVDPGDRRLACPTSRAEPAGDASRNLSTNSIDFDLGFVARRPGRPTRLVDHRDVDAPSQNQRHRQTHRM